jgi:hypothetical protein
VGYMLENLEIGSDIFAELSPQRLMEYTSCIAKCVRLSGSQEERESFEYVQGVLDDIGLKTKLIEHDAFVSLPGDASMEALGPEKSPIHCITHSMAASTPEEGLEADVVYAGSGSPEDLQAVEVDGKVALVDGLAMPTKVKGLEDRGAIAQIHINVDHLHEMIVSTVWGNPTDGNVQRLPKSPVVSILGSTGERLKQHAEHGGLRVRIRARVDTGWRKIPLLQADLPSDRSHDFVMLSGHIDSWHYGAMDNGTANAAMIEIARSLALHSHRMLRGLRLLFWSGHSHGRYAGSAWYADTRWEELHDHCVVHVNVDSIGGKGATVLGHGIIMAETKPLAAAAIKKLTGQDFEGSRCSRAGDQSFWGPGVPSMFMSLSEQPLGGGDTEAAFAQLLGGKAKTGGLGWWWHTPEDTVDKIDPELLLRDTRIYAAVIHELVTDPILPFDYSATARELREALEELNSAAGHRLDLSLLLKRSRDLEARTYRLGERLDELRRRSDDGGEARQTDVERANACIKALGRLLVPLNYTRNGRFDHDPAMAVPPIPVLDELRELGRLAPGLDEAKLLETRLRRACNYVQHTLREATETIDRFVAQR